MKLQILALALLSLGALPDQKKAPDYSKVSRSLLNDLIASKSVDKQVVVLAQASAKELALLAAWDRRSTELVLAFPESEEMEEGTADGLEAKLEAALVASTVEGAAGQAFVASGSTKQPFTFFVTAAVLYLVLTSISTRFFNSAENWANRGVRRV